MGQGRWFSIPKDEISLLEIRSKIEHHRVLNKVQVLDFQALAFSFSLFAPRLHHRMAVLGQNLCFSKKISEGLLSLINSPPQRTLTTHPTS